MSPNTWERKLTPPLTLSPSRASISAGFQPIGCESDGSATNAPLRRGGHASTSTWAAEPANRAEDAGAPSPGPQHPLDWGHRRRLPMASPTHIFSMLFWHRETPMAVTSFEVDERTAALLADLQKTFGVKTNAAVLRKALALANVASQYADADNTITISPADGKPAVKVSLAG